MPRNTEVARREEENSALGFALPDDIRADLLRAQSESIETPQALPRVKIMGAGACLYEFADTSDTTPTFQGVILSNHSRNVLWDRAYDDRPETDNPEDSLPACSSVDGRIGMPRVGFRHEALGGRPALGTERIDCRTCPYNQWGTGAKLITTANPKGKAVTNQRSVYIMVEDRDSPVELVLPPSSLTPLDEYLTMLMNRHLPVQAVLTEFSQVRKTKGRMTYGVATFRMVSTLDEQTFQAVMAKREQYLNTITPQTPAAAAAIEEADMEGMDVTGRDGDEDDLPF